VCRDDLVSARQAFQPKVMRHQSEFDGEQLHLLHSPSEACTLKASLIRHSDSRHFGSTALFLTANNSTEDIGIGIHDQHLRTDLPAPLVPTPRLSCSRPARTSNVDV
jgi:hypothetical protein